MGELYVRQKMTADIKKKKKKSSWIPWIAFISGMSAYPIYKLSWWADGICAGLYGSDSHKLEHLFLLMRGIGGMLMVIGILFILISIVLFIRSRDETMKLPLSLATIPIVIIPAINHLQRLLLNN